MGVVCPCNFYHSVNCKFIFASLTLLSRVYIKVFIPFHFQTQVGNFLFMVLQTLCLIDITGCMCRSLDKRAACSKLWKACQVVVAILVLGLWVIMAIVIFISHGRQEVSNTYLLFCSLLGAKPCWSSPIPKKPEKLRQQNGVSACVPVC